MSVEEVCNNFFHDNNNLASSVLLSYQQQHNNKNTTTSNIINYILNSKEFQKHYQIEFKKVFNAIFETSDNVEYQTIQKKYMTLIAKEKTGVKKESIHDFLKQELLFETHYSNVVKTLYTFYFSDSITDTCITNCIEYFRSLDFIRNSRVSIDEKIKSFVYNRRSPVTSTNSPSFVLDNNKEYFVHLFEQKFNEPPSLDVLNNFNTFFENKTNIIDVFFQNKYNNCSVFYHDIVNTFQHIFHRDITVFEYVKYYTTFSDNSQKEVTTYHSVYNKKFQIVNNIYDQYINSKIDDTNFIHNFLDIIHLDDKMFHQNIVDTVINYESYNSVMGNLIQQIYSNTYDCNISELDRLYFFQKVYSMKYSLIDDHLSKLITTLKEETDTFENVIKSIFERILQRNPERTELDHFIDYFRSPKDNIQPNIKLEDELYESLEYHDIIKLLLTKTYFKQTPNKSELYKMLRHILNFQDPLFKRDPTKIHNEINSHFNIQSS
jgi:hypothetical protein